MRRLFLRGGIRGLMLCTSTSPQPPSLSSTVLLSRITGRFGTTPRPAASRATRLPCVSHPVVRVRVSQRPDRVGDLIVTRDPSGCKRSVEKSYIVLRRRGVDSDTDMVKTRARTINGPLTPHFTWLILAIVTEGDKD